MIIRLATASDLSAINDIYNHYVHISTTTYQETESTMEERRSWFENRDARHVVTVIERSGVVVGWGSLNAFRERSAYRFTAEHSVYVRQDCHRCGIGSMLLADLIERAKAAGFRTLIAGVDSEQAASLLLHQRFGFVECGRFKQVGFKFNRWLDVIFMQRML